LMEFRIGIGRLLNGSLKANRNERRVVEAALSRQPELSLDRKWRRVAIGAYGCKIRRDSQNAFRLLTCSSFT